MNISATRTVSFSDLNIKITTDQAFDLGFFTWEGNSFTQSAENIDLSFREDGVWLEGDLPEVDGGERGRQGINLSEHIENQNGQLVFV